MQETQDIRSGRSPGLRNDSILQYSCLENSMDRGDLQATINGVAKSWTRLSASVHTHTHTHSSVQSLSWVRIFCDPMDCSPWDSPGQKTAVGSLSFLQGIFPTQESNQGLLHCSWILYQLSYQGSPICFTSARYLVNILAS